VRSGIDPSIAPHRTGRLRSNQYEELPKMFARRITFAALSALAFAAVRAWVDRRSARAERRSRRRVLRERDELARWEGEGGNPPPQTN
jgi:hypothetical protein